MCGNGRIAQWQSVADYIVDLASKICREGGGSILPLAISAGPFFFVFPMGFHLSTYPGGRPGSSVVERRRQRTSKKHFVAEGVVRFRRRPNSSLMKFVLFLWSR